MPAELIRSKCVLSFAVAGKSVVCAIVAFIQQPVAKIVLFLFVTRIQTKEQRSTSVYTAPLYLIKSIHSSLSLSTPLHTHASRWQRYSTPPYLRIYCSWNIKAGPLGCSRLFKHTSLTPVPETKFKLKTLLTTHSLREITPPAQTHPEQDISCQAGAARYSASYLQQRSPVSLIWFQGGV
jgi:hypothetical protein